MRDRGVMTGTWDKPTYFLAVSTLFWIKALLKKNTFFLFSVLCIFTINRGFSHNRDTVY